MVQLNKAIIFQGKYIPVLTDILTVFIAWLNLDLGIKTCFYDGMDSYVNTWLQFAFLIYVWSIIGLIIFFSHKYICVTRLVGRNAVKVVATLLLISYSKLQLTAIHVIQFVRLNSSEGECKHVWIYDGNVQYLVGKHIPLFAIAVVLYSSSVCGICFCTSFHSVLAKEVRYEASLLGCEAQACL